jgi:Flp pilus assembly protein TadG
MTRHTRTQSGEAGFVIVQMALLMPVLMIFTGLAVDSGRAYVVKAQLSKAVDGAALGAARMLNSGDPRGEAGRIFNANFPSDFMGAISVTDPATDPDFYEMHTEEDTGLNIVTIRATAVVPTTFMRIGNFTEFTVTSASEASRRMVDLSLVLDTSSSIGSSWGAVRDAARTFIEAFDEDADRLSLVFYGWGAHVEAPMPATRGFDKTGLMAAIPNSLPGGTTPMAEGLYRGWDELRTVAPGQQSGLRVIVLFTDGSGNMVPGDWDGTGNAKSIFTSDFPKRHPDPDNITRDNPQILGLYQTETGARSPSYSITVPYWEMPTVHPSMAWMPDNSSHQHGRSGLPGSFPLQSGSLKVNGVTQSTRRGLRDWDSTLMKYPAHVINIRNAATNLTEIIADAARSDDAGDYRIRIYTIGMGNLVRFLLGAIPETSESVLMRVANDRRSPDFDSTQLEGKYYFAASEADIGPVFQQLQNQIIRLSK